MENPNSISHHLLQHSKKRMSRKSRSSFHCCNARKYDDKTSSRWQMTNNFSHSGIVGASIFYNYSEEASRMTSNTSTNPGRHFHRSSFWKNQIRNCGYFEWEDQLVSPSKCFGEEQIISQLRKNFTIERQLKRIRFLCWILVVMVIILSVLLVVIAQLKIFG